MLVPYFSNGGMIGVTLDFSTEETYPGSGPAGTVLTYLDNYVYEGTNINPITFSGVDFGTAAADRYIIVGYSTRNDTRDITSVTIGGVSATIITQLADGNTTTGMAIAAVPTGTSGDVVVTLTGSADAHYLGVWAVTGLASATPVDTGTSAGSGNDAGPQSFTLDTDANGFVIVVDGSAAGGNGPDDPATVSSNLTLRYDGVTTTPLYTSGASAGADGLTDGTTTTFEITIGDSNNSNPAVAATFEGTPGATGNKKNSGIWDLPAVLASFANAAPSDAGRLAWWDASDTGTISDSGGTVTSVANKVGGGNALVPDTTGQQTTGVTTRNGNNVIDFTGLSNPLEADITFTGTDFAVWIVLSIDAIDSSNDSIFGLWGSTNILNHRANNAAQFDGFVNINYGNNNSWTGGPYSGWMIFHHKHDRSGLNQYTAAVNGTTVVSGSLSADAETTQRLYVQSSQYSHIPGSLAEVVFTTDITVDYLPYLQYKWGFPEAGAASSFTDDFTYADQDLASTGNWAAVTLGLAAEEHADCGVVSNVVTSQTSGSVDALFAYTGGTPAADQYAQCVVASFSTADTTQNGINVLVRSVDADNGYYAEYRTVGRIRVYKIVAGVSTLIGDTTTAGYPLSVGDVLRVEASGTTITVKHNGSTALTITSQADHSSGRCGVGIFQLNTATTAGQIALDNFECGDLPGAGGGGSFSITNTANPTSITNSGAGGNTTFSSVNVGTASADREVYVAVSWFDATGSVTADVSGVTIAGNAATLVAETGIFNANGQTVGAAVYKYNLTTGTTADIVVQLTDNYTYSAISVFDVKGRTTEATNSATASTGTSLSANVNTAAGGALIVAGVQRGSSSGFTLTPTGYTILAQENMHDGTAHDSSANGWNSSTSSASPATVTLATNSGPLQVAALVSVAIS